MPRYFHDQHINIKDFCFPSSNTAFESMLQQVEIKIKYSDIFIIYL